MKTDLTREEMMDKVIKKYDFESEITILFCKACEECDSNSKIRWTYIMLMS